MRPKCALCNQEGFHDPDCPNRYAVVRVYRDAVKAQFTAERYPGTRLLDTTVELELEPFIVIWENKERFLDELQNLLAKYSI